MTFMTTVEQDAFRRDGAAILRGKFPEEWIAGLRRGIDADLANPTANLSRHTKVADAPAYIEDFWAWRQARRGLLSPSLATTGLTVQPRTRDSDGS